jgi:hypothetical protein
MTFFEKYGEPIDMDNRERYRHRALTNAYNDPGPWMSVNIISDSRKRALKHGFNHNLDREYLVALYWEQKGKCAISGVEMEFQSGTRECKNPNRLSIDRIDNTKGYIKGNVRLVTHWVNNAKSTYGDDVLMEYSKKIAKKRR